MTDQRATGAREAGCPCCGSPNTKTYTTSGGAVFRNCQKCFCKWYPDARAEIGPRIADEPPVRMCSNCGHELWSGRCPMCSEHNAETIGEPPETAGLALCRWTAGDNHTYRTSCGRNSRNMGQYCMFCGKPVLDAAQGATP